MRALLLLLLATPALAGPYIDLGLTVQDGCLRDYDETDKRQGCSDNPLGLIAIGYRWHDLMIEVEHRSSIMEKDKGSNAATIKYRFELK